MSVKYYNRHNFSKAMEMEKKDIHLSIELFRQYLEEFSNDYMAKTYYVSALVTSGSLVEAEEALNELEMQICLDKDFTKHKDKAEKNTASLVYSKVRLLIHSNRYEECYKLIHDNIDLLERNNYEVDASFLFCKKMMNNDFHFLSKDNKSYLYRQIDDYSEERFIKHIQKHMPTYSGIEKTTSVFCESFDFDKTFKVIRETIPSKKVLYPGVLEDVYYYKYDSCGKVNNKYTDYFKLVVLHDSKHFITIAPTGNIENLPCIDLNYLQEETPKTNTNSQIDKFNKKYAKYLLKN